jgi:hypothetical protein
VQPRSEAYRDALTRNPGLLKGATLLDVGCGTSILCMFGAQGGAASVVGLDGSARIANCARQVRIVLPWVLPTAFVLLQARNACARQIRMLLHNAVCAAVLVLLRQPWFVLLQHVCVAAQLLW